MTQQSATILPFPRQALPPREGELQRAMGDLAAALRDQHTAMLEWRDALDGFASALPARSTAR